MKKLLLLLTMCVLFVGVAQAGTLFSNTFDSSADCDTTYWSGPSGAVTPVFLTDIWVSSPGSCGTDTSTGFNGRYRDMAYDGSQTHNVSVMMIRNTTQNYEVRMATDSAYTEQIRFGMRTSVSSTNFFYNVGPGNVDSGVAFDANKWYNLVFAYNTTHMNLYVNDTLLGSGSKLNKDYSFFFIEGVNSNMAIDELYAFNSSIPPAAPATHQCSDSEAVLANYSVFDRTTGLNINAQFSGVFTYTSAIHNGTQTIVNDSADAFFLCGHENLTAYNGTLSVSYKGVPTSGYPERYYINKSMTGDNSSVNVTIYTRPIEESVGVVANVKTDDDEKLANHIIELIRFDEANATGSSSDFQITDQNGKANFFVDYAGPRYGFVVRDNNYNVLETTDFAAIVESPFNLIVADNFTNPFQWHIVGSSISADLTYTNSTKSFNFTWTDIDEADNLCLLIKNSTGGTLFDQCSSSTSGSLNHTLISTTGTFTGLAVFEYAGVNHTYDLKSVSLFGLADQLGKDDALMFAYLFFVTISLISFFSPTGGVVGGGVALILIFFTEMLPIGVREIVGVLMFAIIIFSLFRGRTGA